MSMPIFTHCMQTLSEILGHFQFPFFGAWASFLPPDRYMMHASPFCPHARCDVPPCTPFSWILLRLPPCSGQWRV